jgi:CheY-like chemotaxis protein
MPPAILLAEDDPLDIDLAHVAFARAGWPHPLTVARDGAEALERMAGPAPPAVALLDLKMPGMSGLDLLRARRADPRLRAVPVVVLSSSPEPSDVAACYDAGANAYLVKPAGLGMLAEVAGAVVAAWLVRNVRPPVPAG